jgi:5-methylcytosine-specific restriction endonuclease McrA
MGRAQVGVLPPVVKRKVSYAVQRQSLWRRKFRRCYYCELRLTLTAGKPNTMTLDHKIPLSRGGPNQPFNYVAACRPCNTEKGSLTEAEYWALRRRRAKATRPEQL